MMKSICAVVRLGVLSGMIAVAPGAFASAADLTEEQIRAIATEIAERVAREVATEVAGVIAAQMAEEIAAEVAAEVVEEVLASLTTEDDSPELALTPEFLADPAHIAAGQEIWVGQCALCHGANSYPGKAPKLKPKRYTPEFVFDRVTNGFRKMPAWREVYTEQERMSLVAWILSRKFSP